MSEQRDSVRIGASACLLGQRVRFDGGHKKDPFLTETLARLVELVPVCPELELGLGAPRESLRLVRRDGEVRLVAPRSGADHTDSMRRWAAGRLRALAALDLCGYVLKKDSPSCGMERVRVYGQGGAPAREGTGLFAQALLEAFPGLPVEEEGRLHDPRLRESFFERVFAYRRLQGLFRPGWRPGDLVRFHTAEKLLLMAHDEPRYRALGRLVAAVRRTPRAELEARYREGFMAALATRATTRTHTNVLQHMVGFLRGRLGAEARAEQREVIEDYRQGLIPLVVPITLLRHHVRACGVDYLAGQTYLEPSPKELMVRNHA